MDISDILNKEKFTEVVINELRSYGVKYQKGKKKKTHQSKTCRKHIFRTHMHLLELTDVILANGKVVQIPKFVADACNRILEQVETEGLFRKAGSFARQKEIRLNLEAGKALGKTHHVIDVANVVKYFFRELPEPLIPPNIQETFLQSFLIGENYINAILLSCLLLPPLTINTLSFFMQFLYTISLNQCYNKMSIENLAIIFTPGIMPYPNINSHRFSNHVKIISILIENSNSLGVIPCSIKNQIEQSSPLSITEPSTLYGPLPECELNTSHQNEIKESSSKKKKKRRSDMFNGLKRIVGTAMGSSEFLDHTSSENKDNVRYHKANERKCVSSESYTTPCIKEFKKRKFGETMSATSTKKKKDLLGLLPTNSGGFLPNTPSTKNSKKSRLSFGCNRHIKQTLSNPVVISMERRWSVVGSGWSKTKKSSIENKKKSNNICDEKAKKNQNESTGDQVNVDIVRLNSTAAITENSNNVENNDICIQISKNEYEEIKERVAAIEARISNEFTVLEDAIVADKFSGPEHVQTQYERIIVETEALSSPTTQRLNRGLKIRQSIDHCVIRSPSARKIGTIRRKSLDKARLSRNSSWNVRSKNIACKESKLSIEMENVSSHISSKTLNYKNKVSPFKSSKDCSLTPPEGREKDKFKYPLTNISDDSNEQWMSGVDFFNGIQTKCSFYKGNQDTFDQTHVEHVATPVSHKYNLDSNNTTVVPPKSYTKKSSTPSHFMSTDNKFSFINRVALSTPATEEISGRASIARLRTQNAGMVMAKAKLFDGLECYSKERQSLQKNNQNIKKSEISNKSYTGKEQKSFFTDDNILLIESNDINILQSKLEGTPIARRIQNINLNSPISSPKRRQRTNVNKCNKKQVIQTVITDGKLVRNRSLNERPLNSDKELDLSLKRKIVISYPRGIKSPKVVKTNRQNSKLRTTTSGIQRQNY